MAGIGIGSGEDARLRHSYIQEVRDLVTSCEVNELWLLLTTQPLYWHTHDLFAQVLEDQDPEDAEALDRLGVLHDAYVEFVVEHTGQHPSQRVADVMSAFAHI